MRHYSSIKLWLLITILLPVFLMMTILTILLLMLISLLWVGNSHSRSSNSLMVEPTSLFKGISILHHHKEARMTWSMSSWLRAWLNYLRNNNSLPRMNSTPIWRVINLTSNFKSHRNSSYRPCFLCPHSVRMQQLRVVKFIKKNQIKTRKKNSSTKEADWWDLNKKRYQKQRFPTLRTTSTHLSNFTPSWVKTNSKSTGRKVRIEAMKTFFFSVIRIVHRRWIMWDSLVILVIVTCLMIKTSTRALRPCKTSSAARGSISLKTSRMWCHN